MRNPRSFGRHAIMIAGVVMTMLASSTSAAASAAPTKTSVIPNAAPATATQPVPLDLGAATIRDAARVTAQSTDDALVDDHPDGIPGRLTAFKEIPPTCSALETTVAVVVVVAACAKGQCNSVGNPLYDASTPLRRTDFPQRYPTGCKPRTIKLW